jgi:glycosyltransferase involved in cell wall biosynthesis
LVKLTIAICTRNRAASLSRALERLCALHIPGGVTWEVVVIDNGSTDATGETIARFAPQLPLSSDFEPKPGVAIARNRALAAATGEFVLWIDDDVLVGPDWLAGYARSIAQHPDADVFGGPVRPLLEGTPPTWLTRALPEIGPVYCAVDIDGVPIRFDRDSRRIPLGSSYVVRRAAALAAGYDPNLGPGSPVAPLSDETDLIRRILAGGAYGVWVPEAGVDHVIGPERQTVAYIRRYYVGYGMTLRYLASRSPRREALWFGVPRWLFGELAGSWLAYVIGRATVPPERWLGALARHATCRGVIKAARRTARESHT